MIIESSEPKYFAVPDPDNRSVMTYWRRTGNGDLIAHPPKANYGPMLWRRPGPDHVHTTPTDLRGPARRAWINRWYATVRATWETSIRAAIESDPATAAARFGALATRCCCCGRALTDPTSTTYGIGPECRSGLPDRVLAAYAAAVSRAHAAQVADEATQLELFGAAS